MRESKSNANSDTDGYAHTDSYANSDSNRYAYTDSYANCYSDRYAYANSNAYCYSDCDHTATAFTDASASADPAAAPLGFFGIAGTREATREFPA